MTLYPFEIEPASLLHEPPVMLPGVLSLREDGELLGQTRVGLVGAEVEAGCAPLTRMLPLEFYLRQLMDFDTASDEALIGFMEEYGLLGTTADTTASFGTLFAPRSKLQTARLQAVALRNATRTLLANEQQLALSELLDEWELPGPDMRTSVVFQPDRLESAVALTTSRINHWLAPLAPRIRRRGGPKVEALGVPLETAVAVQMFNHLAEGASYRKCELPSCSRVFVRQVGRARKGQHKIAGVKFCSPACASAAAARAYRASKRAKRTQTQGGDGV